MDQNPDISEQRSEAIWQHRAEMALASVIAADRLITYAELADAASIPPPHRIHRLTLWLETSLVADHQAGAKLRAARVISRNRGGIPAPGFFIKCRELGLYDGPTDGPLAQAFHLNLLG
ncbi:MAG: hypothetical protein EVA91_06140 [SAR116 cluster bacterium]|nr:MAG: hypothetical protein EVA91_06140 [SAR116 cluster bacterium]|tara:strand:+ start:2294 stop:2650 length:357 start_codon:yes stop_codon:yes gene_type:complete